MVKGQTHIRCVNPCRRCVHLRECQPFLRRLGEAVVWEAAHHAGYEVPAVIVDCGGRFTPPGRYRKVRVA